MSYKEPYIALASPPCGASTGCSTSWPAARPRAGRSSSAKSRRSSHLTRPAAHKHSRLRRRSARRSLFFATPHAPALRPTLDPRSRPDHQRGLARFLGIVRPPEREKQGSVALLADGVGGYEHGEVASRLAVDEALRDFKEGPPTRSPTRCCAGCSRRLLAGAQRRARRAGASRWRRRSTASIFRDRTVCVAHVGDTRAYFIRQKTIRRLTKDHVATALPVKLG